ncbi:MAG: hypothetical protein K5Q68_14955 [Roseococcus sp.]|nr:hypothetical protein [Roseococcus sp.]
MSPEAQARIARVAEEIWRVASAPGAAKDQAKRAQTLAYAKGMLETTVEGEVQRRVGELGLG